MNEVPLCELALSCDNLLCDAHGRPPSPMIVIYVRYPKGLSVRYGATETVEVSKSHVQCLIKNMTTEILYSPNNKKKKPESQTQ